MISKLHYESVIISFNRLDERRRWNVCDPYCDPAPIERVGAISKSTVLFFLLELSVAAFTATGTVSVLTHEDAWSTFRATLFLSGQFFTGKFVIVALLQDVLLRGSLLCWCH